MVIGLSGIAPFSVNAEHPPITQYGSNGNFIAPIEPIADYTGWTAISNRAELEAIVRNLNGKYYLTGDIDLFGAEWMPISTFTGIFDGQGYTIRNMKSSYDMESNYGLFGKTSNAVIKNIGMEDTQISPVYGYFGAATAGGICGLASSTVISNCYNTGVISADDLTNSASHFGGICGLAFDTFINDCYNTASISVSPADSVARHLPYYYVGGICGLAPSTAVGNCYNTGAISVSGTSYDVASSYIGGICGESSSSISYCYNAGSVSGSSASGTLAGGICGNGNGASISDCYNTASISAYDNLGALAGGICGMEGYYGVTIGNCYNTGSVSAAARSRSFAGGICGSTKSPSSISNSYWNSDSTQTVNEAPQSPKKGVGDGTDTTTPLITGEMKRQGSFAGFDFDTVWGIDKGNDYPYLRVFNSSTEPQQAIENLEMVYDLSSVPNVVQVTLSRPLSGDTLFVAYYDGAKLMGFNATPIPQESTPDINIYHIRFTELIPQTAKVKAFVWDNLGNMQPLCPAKTMEYENDSWVMVD